MTNNQDKYYYLLPSERTIIVEADYETNSVWVDCDYIDLTEEELDALSTALWKIKYEYDCDLWNRGRRQQKQWQFVIPSILKVRAVSKVIVEVIQELFSDKLVEFSEVNPIEDFFTGKIDEFYKQLKEIEDEN